MSEVSHDTFIENSPALLSWHEGRLPPKPSLEMEPVIARAISIVDCDELCRLYGVPPIPQHLIPRINITETDNPFAGQYHPIWNYSYMPQSWSEQPPLISVSRTTIGEAFIEELGHFIVDYYHTINPPALPWKGTMPGHPLQQFADVPLFDNKTGSFVEPYEVRRKYEGDWERVVSTDAFVLGGEAVARAGASLFFGGELTSGGPPRFREEVKGNVVGFWISEASWIPIGVKYSETKLHLPNWPDDVLTEIRSRGIFDVVSECEFELSQLLRSIEEMTQDLRVAGPTIVQAVFDVIPHLVKEIRESITHWIGYTIGEACASRILKDPDSRAEYAEIAFRAPHSIHDWIDSMVKFAG